jgi:outer membrane protein OmpA-like peptidoglycan-associated protein
MENLMLTNIEVTEDDLQQLAKQRAQGVKEYLLQSGQIDAERIFLVKPKTSSPEKKDNIKSSRVDFAIQ